MDVSAHSPDPIERALGALRAEYADKIDAVVLARTLREAYQHAYCLGLLNKPRLVDKAVRDVLNDHLERARRRA